MTRKKDTKSAGRKKVKTGARSGGRNIKSKDRALGGAIPPGLTEIFYSARDGMVLMDCQNWDIIDINPSFEQMVGYKRKELAGKKIWEVPNTNNGEQLKRSFFKIFQGGACHLDHVPLQTKSDDLIDTQLNTTIIDSSDASSMLCIFRPGENNSDTTNGFLGTGMGLTEPVEIEQFSSELLDNANLIVMFIGPDGNLVVFNHNAEEFTGKSRDDVIGKRFYDVLVAPKNRLEVKKKFGEMIGGTDFIEGHDYPILNSHGVERLVQWRNSLISNNTGAIVGLLSLGEDITEMKVLERRLKLYSDAIKSSIDSMIIMDMNGYIIYNNRAAEAIYGYNTGELRGKNLKQIYNSGRGDEFSKVLEALTKKDSWQGERIHKKSDGTYTSVYQTMSQITDEQGRPIAIMVVGRDVTASKRLEHDLKTARRHSEFYLDILTHDLSNLNQGILSQLDVIRRNTAFSNDNRKYIDCAMGHLNTGIDLINNVKKLTMIENNKVKQASYELRSVIDYCKNRIGMRYPTRKIQLWGNYKQVNYTILADEFIYDIFTNLLDNSVKFDGHKLVEIGINISELKKNGRNYVKISILDSGCGIPISEKKSVFERFYKNEGFPKSTGLGLSIVKALVDRYGGKISVDDRVRDDHTKGSIFTVILPTAA